MKEIVFIFGDPGNGKSHLAKEYGDHGYDVLSLDTLYLDFIQEKYSTLYLPDLAVVISQHYKTILSEVGKRAWEKYVASSLKNFIKNRENIVVEGYLLEIILDGLRARFSSTNITVVEVKNGEYYILTDIDWEEE